MQSHTVFVTGATGYLGKALIPELVARGCAVRALCRRGSESRVPRGAETVVGDALDAATFSGAVPPAETLVHLVGTPHPNPSKAGQFRDVDLVSVRAALAAARSAGVRHFVYLSVAYPAPIMQAYIDVRREGERMIAESGTPATFLRPFYVLGPGHWWPYALLPAFAVLRAIPATRAGAERLGPVTLAQMVRALVNAVEHPPASGVRGVDAPEIRR